MAGKIPGLTPALEEILKRGTITIFEWPGDGYWIKEMPKGVGSTESISRRLSYYGQLLPEQNKEGERAAYLAAQKWREDQAVFPGTNIAGAKKILKKKIQRPYGITAGGKCSAGTLYLVIDILNLLPERVLKSKVLKCINLDGQYSTGAYFGDFENGYLGITSTIDRYLFTGYLLHELGHVVEEFLIKEGKQSEIDRLHNKFRSAGAIFVTDYLYHDKKYRKFYVSDPSEFVAENFFHFIIFGKEMLKGPHQDLRLELYELYAGLYMDPHFDAILALAV